MSLPEPPSIAITIDEFNADSIIGLVTKYIEELERALPRLIRDLEEVTQTLTTTDERSMTPLKYTLLQNRQRCLEGAITTAECKIDLYRNSVVPLHTRLSGIKRRIVFGERRSTRERQVNHRTCFSDDQRSTIREFIQLIGRIIDVVIEEPVEHMTHCPVCRQPFQRDTNSLSCQSCGQQLEAYTFSVNSENDDQRYVTDDNFIKALRVFQGKDNIHLPSQWREKLDEYFQSIGFPHRDEICQLPHNEDGTRGNTNRKLLREALKKIAMPNYAEINYIGHLYWDWTLPDLTEYEELLINTYNEMEQYYQECLHELGIQASSSINMNYRLYKQLELIGYPCFSSDFDISPSDETRRKYEQLWQLMCQKSGKSYIPTRWD